MFAIRLRVSPCTARSGPRSVGRLTVRVSPSSTISIRVETRCSSSPLGPLTVTRPGPTETLTPSGTVIGFLPIRLISTHQTYATTSPPTPLAFASCPVITPVEVEMIEVPMPPWTRGTSSWVT